MRVVVSNDSDGKLILISSETISECSLVTTYVPTRLHSEIVSEPIKAYHLTTSLISADLMLLLDNATRWNSTYLSL